MPKNVADIKRRLVQTAEAEIRLCLGVASLALARRMGYEELFVLNGSRSAPESQSGQRKLAVRGVKRVVAERNNDLSITYRMTVATLGYDAYLIHYYGDPNQDWGIEAADNAQSAITATAGEVLAFESEYLPLTKAKGRIFQLRTAAGVDVHNLTALTMAGTEAQYGADGDATALVEGIDFEVDLELGTVKFLKNYAAPEDDITPTLTAKAVAAGDEAYRKRIKPLQKGAIDCFGDFIPFDEDGGVFMRHKDFQGQIKPDGELTYNGEWLEFGVMLTVIEEGVVEARAD